jgi:superfamily I DNA/RNA helicase
MTFPSKEQEAVLNPDHEHVLLFAAAGAGKTDVLTAKIKIEAHKLDTNNGDRYKQNKPYVLVLTHTRNARDNIQKRINESESNIKIKKLIHIRTFHSFALQHINKNNSHYTVKNDCDEQIIRQIVANWSLKYKIKKR